MANYDCKTLKQTYSLQQTNGNKKHEEKSFRSNKNDSSFSVVCALVWFIEHWCNIQRNKFLQQKNSVFLEKIYFNLRIQVISAVHNMLFIPFFLKLNFVQK